MHELPLALTDVFLVSFQEILRNKKRSRATRGILCHLGSSRSHQALRLRPGNTRTRTAFFTASNARFTASNGSSRLGLQQRRRQICRLTTGATTATTGATTATSCSITRRVAVLRCGCVCGCVCGVCGCVWRVPKVCRVPGGSNTPTTSVIWPQTLVA